MPAACLMFAALLLTPALAGTSKLDPDKPRFHFWWRNVADRVIEAGAMNAEVQQIADAFGAGDYGESRRLAEALLEATDDADLRSQAGSFIIESHLAEGDFEGARAEARRLGDDAALARIKAAKQWYDGYVSHLNSVLAGVADSSREARAQLSLAHVHHMASRRAEARAAYGRVIEAGPDHMAARLAVGRLALLLSPQRNHAGALAELDIVLNRHLDTGAATALAEIYHRMAHQLMARQDRAGAVLAWERACYFDTDPMRRAQSLVYIGESLVTLGRFEEAHACLALLREDPVLASTKWGRTADYLDAVAYHEAGDSEQAVSLLEKIVTAPGPPEEREAAEAMLEHLGHRLER